MASIHTFLNDAGHWSQTKGLSSEWIAICCLIMYGFCAVYPHSGQLYNRKISIFSNDNFYIPYLSISQQSTKNFLTCCVAETEAFTNAPYICIIKFWTLVNASHNAGVWGVYKRFCFGYTATVCHFKIIWNIFFPKLITKELFTFNFIVSTQQNDLSMLFLHCITKHGSSWTWAYLTFWQISLTNI